MKNVKVKMLLKNIKCQLGDVQNKSQHSVLLWEGMWFQHDGATPHLSKETINLLKNI